MLSIIVAIDLNGGIGNNNELLFHVKEDMRRFKELTTNHKVIMGRKTFESLPNGALPNRTNIVLSRSKMGLDEELDICYMYIVMVLEEYRDSNEEVFIIGGGEIYSQLLPYCNKIYLTIGFGEFEADTFFNFNKDEWEIDGLSTMHNTFAFYNYKRKE